MFCGNVPFPVTFSSLPVQQGQSQQLFYTFFTFYLFLYNNIKIKYTCNHTFIFPLSSLSINIKLFYFIFILVFFFKSHRNHGYQLVECLVGGFWPLTSVAMANAAASPSVHRCRVNVGAVRRKRGVARFTCTVQATANSSNIIFIIIIISKHAGGGVF